MWEDEGHIYFTTQGRRRRTKMDLYEVNRILVFLVLFWNGTESLICYTCRPSSSRDTISANENCLANSTEVTCRSDQDRCYSLTTTTSGEVRMEKGCTRSERCLGNRICCSQDFCNAGQGSDLKTGEGKSCNDVSACVQGSVDMTCSARSQRDMTRVCQCRESRYVIGAICRNMSKVGGMCHLDEHCLPVNSFCQLNRCRCGDYFYANDTICSLKVGLSAPCIVDRQCRPQNSECVGGFCTCKPGYDTFMDTGVCTGSNLQISLILLVSCLLYLTVQYTSTSYTEKLP